MKMARSAALNAGGRRRRVSVKAFLCKRLPPTKTNWRKIAPATSIPNRTKKILHPISILKKDCKTHLRTSNPPMEIHHPPRATKPHNTPHEKRPPEEPFILAHSRTTATAKTSNPLPLSPRKAQPTINPSSIHPSHQKKKKKNTHLFTIPYPRNFFFF